MVKRLSLRNEQDHDFSVMAYRIVQESTGKAKPTEDDSDLTAEERHAVSVALGRLSDWKGGPARAKKLNPKRRGAVGKKHELILELNVAFQV